MERKQASEFDQELLNLYDDYAHGRIHRRGFLEGAAKFAVGGLTAEALLSTLSPNYAWAQQVAKGDPRLKTEYLEYASPRAPARCEGIWSGRLPPRASCGRGGRPRKPRVESLYRRRDPPPGIAGSWPWPRRLDAVGRLSGQRRSRSRDAEQAGFGGDDTGLHRGRGTAAETSARQRQGGRGRFCYGGGIANTLAVRIPDVIAAAVPFYGRQPASDECEDQGTASDPLRRTRHPHQRRLASLRTGPEGGPGAVRGAPLPGVNHGFHNDTTPAMTKRRPSWPGSAQSTSSTRTCVSTQHWRLLLGVAVALFTLRYAPRMAKRTHG